MVAFPHGVNGADPERDRLRARVAELEQLVAIAATVPATTLPPRPDGQARDMKLLGEPEQKVLREFIVAGLCGRPMLALFDDLLDSAPQQRIERAVYRLLNTVTVALALEDRFPALPIAGGGLKAVRDLALKKLEETSEFRAAVHHVSRDGDTLSIAFDATRSPVSGTLVFAPTHPYTWQVAGGRRDDEAVALRFLLDRHRVRVAANDLAEGRAPSAEAVAIARRGAPETATAPTPTSTTPAAEPTIGQQLRAARDAAGLSRRELAVRLRCSVAAVKSWECARFRPGPGHLDAVRKFIAEHTPPRSA